MSFDKAGKGTYSVGIEAGQFQIDVLSKAIFQITVVCITDGKKESMGAGPFFELPRKLAKKVIPSDTGSVARVTRGEVKRSDVTRDAVIMALAPFVSPDLYGRWRGC